MDEKYSEIQSAISDFLKAWAILKNLKVLNNKKDFTSQLGEFIVAKIYEGNLSNSSNQKDWDIHLKDGTKIQVKSHAKAETNKTRWTEISYDEDANIDLFIVVVFNEDYKLKHFFEISWTSLWKLSKKNRSKRVINWNKLSDYDKLRKSDFIKMDLLRLFV